MTHRFVHKHFSYGRLASILPFASDCLNNLKMTRGQNDSCPLLCKYRMTNSVRKLIVDVIFIASQKFQEYMSILNLILFNKPV